jgi:exosortase/archaeosortase family protein
LAHRVPQVIRAKSGLFFKLLLLASFAVPFIWLYFLDGLSFELMWKGRTFQLFFIWLIGLELILDWETLRATKLNKLFSPRTVAFTLALVLPTLYVAASYYGGLNGAITNWATQSSIQWADSMPLSTEYLVFALLFCLIIWLSAGIKGLKAFFVPTFFLVLVGILYTIDNVFPYGQFTPFQIFVPTTTALAAAFLNMMGYSTSISYEQSNLQGNMPILTATNLQTGASSTFQIAWPCAGIESFLIFTVIILLFLKRMPLSWKSKLGYFIFGAAVTYIINSLRIVNIFLIDMSGGNIDMFHFYYGPLFAMAWIVSYPVIILLSQKVWKKIRKTKQPTQAQQASLNPA